MATVALYNYFKQSSYNQLFVTTHFFPQPDNDDILSYQDIHPRNFYVPWSEINPDGYASDAEKRKREFDLLGRAIQYVENMEIVNSNLDTKDAFWHSRNVVVRNSIVKGEYLAWDANGITFKNCKISGTQPLCYCKGLKLINCTMEGCDLAFEYSEVNAKITLNLE